MDPAKASDYKDASSSTDNPHVAWQAVDHELLLISPLIHVYMYIPGEWRISNKMHSGRNNQYKAYNKWRLSVFLYSSVRVQSKPIRMKPTSWLLLMICHIMQNRSLILNYSWWLIGKMTFFRLLRNKIILIFTDNQHYKILSFTLSSRSQSVSEVVNREWGGWLTSLLSSNRPITADRWTVCVCLCVCMWWWWGGQQ